MSKCSDGGSNSVPRADELQPPSVESSTRSTPAGSPPHSRKGSAVPGGIITPITESPPRRTSLGARGPHTDKVPTRLEELRSRLSAAASALDPSDSVRRGGRVGSPSDALDAPGEHDNMGKRVEATVHGSKYYTTTIDVDADASPSDPVVREAIYHNFVAYYKPTYDDELTNFLVEHEIVDYDPSDINVKDFFRANVQDVRFVDEEEELEDVSSPDADMNSEASPKTWNCPTCTYDNQSETLRCEICQAAKPDDEKPFESEDGDGSKIARASEAALENMYIACGKDAWTTEMRVKMRELDEKDNGNLGTPYHKRASVHIENMRVHYDKIASEAVGGCEIKYLERFEEEAAKKGRNTLEDMLADYPKMIFYAEFDKAVAIVTKLMRIQMIPKNAISRRRRLVVGQDEHSIPFGGKIFDKEGEPEKNDRGEDKTDQYLKNDDRKRNLFNAWRKQFHRIADDHKKGIEREKIVCALRPDDGMNGYHAVREGSKVMIQDRMLGKRTPFNYDDYTNIDNLQMIDHVVEGWAKQADHICGLGEQFWAARRRR